MQHPINSEAPTTGPPEYEKTITEYVCLAHLPSTNVQNVKILQNIETHNKGSH